MFRRFRGISSNFFVKPMRSIVMYMRNILNVLANTPRRAILPLAFVGLLSVPAIAGPMPPEAGVWIDDSGKGAVKIEPCGGDKLCGRIVWLRDPINAQGEPLTDKNNPEEGKRKRPICGLATLGDLKPSPDGGFDFGWVYDPKVGKSYTVAIALQTPSKLQVTGYLGMKFLGKSFIWTRADKDLPSCKGPSEATAPPAVKPAASVKKAAVAAPTATAVAKPQVAKPAAAGDAAAPTAKSVATKPAATKPPKPSATTKAKAETLPWATDTKPSAVKAAAPTAAKPTAAKVAKPVAKPAADAADAAQQ